MSVDIGSRRPCCVSHVQDLDFIIHVKGHGEQQHDRMFYILDAVKTDGVREFNI